MFALPRSRTGSPPPRPVRVWVSARPGRKSGETESVVPGPTGIGQVLLTLRRRARL